MANALTFLEDVKVFGDTITTNTDDQLLTRLILQASRAIYAYLNLNTLFLNTFSDSYDGVNNTRFVLKMFPIISVSSVYIDGKLIPQAPAQPQYGAGWRLELFNGVPPGKPQILDLYGYRFYKGYQNVYITYNAGYSIQAEKQTIPLTAPYSLVVHQIYGGWAQDDGVVSTDGVVFNYSANLPNQGEYTIDVSTGTYLFNSADAGTQLLISYSYVPADIEQACIELVRERYAYSKRMGQKSKSLGGAETATYDLSSMSEYVKMLLRPYKRTNVL